MSQVFVSTVAWVSRGHARKVPKEIQFTEEQIEQMRNDPLIKKNLNKKIDELNDIDIQGEEEDEGDNLPVFTTQLQEMGMQAEHDEKYPVGIDDLDDDEKEDYYIKETDALIVAGKVDKEYASLEVYVYEQDRNNLYVHHEIMLSSFPLDIKWLSVTPMQVEGTSLTQGNFAVVSSFLPEIQIWDLDVSDPIQPSHILGGELETNKAKPKKFKNSNAKKYRPGSHTDSVLSLSINPFRKNGLASGSADQTVKIWDLNKGENVLTFSNHKDKVQKVEWSPVEETILLSASFDKTIAIRDCRFSQDALVHNPGSLESACWNPNNSSQIAFTTEEGFFGMLDVKMPGKNLFSFKAHNMSATGVRISSKNMAATCSEDGWVKIWDVLEFQNSKPSLIHSQNPKCDKLFCVQFYENSEVLCCGNSQGELFVWDTAENENIRNHFQKYA